MSKNPRVIFMGTPEIAAYILNRLIEEKFNIIAVVTAPDKASGRGLKIKYSEVKKVALQNNLKIFQPHDLTDNEFIKNIKELSPDIQIVVAFRKLPKVLWQIPESGTINMHASLLPNYRGAAPINWVIINGEKETGVTTFIIDDKIDTGNILLRKSVQIEPKETAGSLHEKIKKVGGELVVETISKLDKLKPTKQSNFTEDFKYIKKAPKIHKEDCRINWNNSAKEIVNLIHGLNPIPGAFTDIPLFDDKPFYFKIYDAEPEYFNHDNPSQTILSDNKTFLKISTPDGAVNIKELQIPGKKRFFIDEFLRGYNITQK